MHLNAKQLFWVALSGMLISLTVHLLTVLNIFLAPSAVTISLTIGILLVWLQSSRQIKLFLAEDNERNPWKSAFALCPSWVKYVTYFFAVYAFINFAISAEIDHTAAYINLNVSQPRLRGLSGFWLAFYALGLSIGYAGWKREKEAGAK